MARRIVQIEVCPIANTPNTQRDYIVHALCNDGSVWETDKAGNWLQLYPMPDAPDTMETAQQSTNNASAEILQLLREVVGDLNNFNCENAIACCQQAIAKLSHVA